MRKLYLRTKRQGRGGAQAVSPLANAMHGLFWIEWVKIGFGNPSFDRQSLKLRKWNKKIHSGPNFPGHLTF